MADERYILIRPPQLPELANVQAGAYVVGYDTATDRTVKINVSALGGGEQADINWRSNVTYSINEIVEYGLKIWKSLVNDNLGNFPNEGANWTEVSKAGAGSNISNYTPGVYTYDPTIVLREGRLYYLNAAKPFESVDFIAELEANQWREINRSNLIGVDTEGSDYFLPLIGDTIIVLYATSIGIENGIETVLSLPVPSPSYVVRIGNGYTVGDFAIIPFAGEGDLTPIYDIFIDQNDPTGFIHPSDINAAYDKTTRTVTLTTVAPTTLDCYLKGESLAIFKGLTTWTSPAHADVPGNYFLKVTKITKAVEFTTAPWEFDCVQIAYAQYQINNSFGWGIGETHGCNMDNATHDHLHRSVGTFLISGGDMGAIVLLSTVLANRRPTVSQTVVLDEDKSATITALPAGAYTHRYLEGTENKRSFSVDNPDIVRLVGEAPQINVFDGTTWGWQTLVTNNTFIKLFLVAIPVTSDAESQKFRFVWAQAQQTNVNIDVIRGITTSDYILGDSAILASEFVFIGEVIIRYQTAGGGSWSIFEAKKLTGTKLSQTSSPSGNFLTIVSSDETLSGSGTAGDPLSAVNDAPLANIESAALAKTNVVFGNINARLFEQIGFVLAGYDIDVTTASQDILKSLPYAFKAYELKAEFATAPTGSSAIITFYKNGVSIGTVTILAGEFSGTTALSPIVTFAKGDSLSAVVTQIGMTIPGKTAKAYIQGIKYQ